MQKIKKYLGYVLLGIFLLAVGILFISFNGMLKALIISIGVVLSIFGVVLALLTIARKERDLKFAFRIAFSVICLVAGIITACFNDGASEIIASLFSLLLIVDGAFKLNTSAMAKRYGLKSWLAMLIPSVLLIVGGFAVTKFPPDSSELISIFLGILIIIDSLINFASVYFVPMFEKRMREQILEEHGNASGSTVSKTAKGANDEPEKA